MADQQAQSSSSAQRIGSLGGGDGGNGSGAAVLGPKKRISTLRSCRQCREKRQKCSRGQPCTQCVTSDQGDICDWTGSRPLPPHRLRTQNDMQELQSKLDRLESLVKEATKRNSLGKNQDLAPGFHPIPRTDGTGNRKDSSPSLEGFKKEDAEDSPLLRSNNTVVHRDQHSSPESSGGASTSSPHDSIFTSNSNITRSSPSHFSFGGGGSGPGGSGGGSAILTPPHHSQSQSQSRNQDHYVPSSLPIDPDLDNIAEALTKLALPDTVRASKKFKMAMHDEDGKLLAEAKLLASAIRPQIAENHPLMGGGSGNNGPSKKSKPPSHSLLRTNPPFTPTFTPDTRLIPQLLPLIPPPHLTEELLRVYYDYLDNAYHPFHVPSLKRRVKEFWKELERVKGKGKYFNGGGGQGSDSFTSFEEQGQEEETIDPHWLATLLSACSLSIMTPAESPKMAHFSSEKSGRPDTTTTGGMVAGMKQDEKEALGREWAKAALRALDLYPYPTFEGVRAVILIGRFFWLLPGDDLLFCRSLNSKAILWFNELGMNTDPGDLLFDPPLVLSEKEERRRVAFILAQIEFMNTSLHGRVWSPLDERNWSVRLPSELSDEEIERLSEIGEDLPDKEMRVQNSKKGLGFYHKVAMFLRKADVEIFGRKDPPYQTVLDLAQACSDLRQSMPKSYRLDFSSGDITKQLTGASWFDIRRAHINAALAMAEIRIHRPFFMPNGENRPYSVNAGLHRAKVVEHAKQILVIQRSKIFHRHGTAIQFYATVADVVLAVDLLRNPNQSGFDQTLKDLRWSIDYMKTMQSQSPTMRSSVAILGLLLKKIDAMEGQRLRRFSKRARIMTEDGADDLPATVSSDLMPHNKVDTNADEDLRHKQRLHPPLSSSLTSFPTPNSPRTLPLPPIHEEQDWVPVPHAIRPLPQSAMQARRERLPVSLPLPPQPPLPPPPIYSHETADLFPLAPSSTQAGPHHPCIHTEAPPLNPQHHHHSSIASASVPQSYVFHVDAPYQHLQHPHNITSASTSSPPFFSQGRYWDWNQSEPIQNTNTQAAPPPPPPPPPLYLPFTGSSLWNTAVDHSNQLMAEVDRIPTFSDNAFNPQESNYSSNHPPLGHGRHAQDHHHHQQPQQQLWTDQFDPESLQLPADLWPATAREGLF